MHNRTRHCLLLSFSLFTIGHCFADLPQDPTEYTAWEARFLSAIEQERNTPPESSIPKLGNWVRKLSRGTNREKGERPVFHAAQELLLSMPGHSRYYQNKLESLRANILEAAKLPEDPFRKKVNSALGDYEDFRARAFPILGLLPSSETVAVLGLLLNDPEGRDGKNILGEPFIISDATPFPINAGAAAIAIRQLGIEHPPFRERPGAFDYEYHPEEIDAWRDWWNEVKEGKRTYRFIGSSIEYGPDGPASKEQLQRIERNRQRDAASNRPRSAASPAEAEEQPHTKIGIAIGGALLVLLASIFYVLRAKKRSPR
jgi:hypothetical protein